MAKKTWITRNRFGNDNLYSIRVQKLSQNKRINEHFFVSFSQFEDDFRDFIQNKLYDLPFQSDVLSLIQLIFENCSSNPSVADFNISSTHHLCSAMEIEFTSDLSSQLDCLDRSFDELLIDICHEKKYNKYINLESGRDLYSEAKFFTNGIDLVFNDSTDLRRKLADDFFQSILFVIAKHGILNVKKLLLT